MTISQEETNFESVYNFKDQIDREEELKNEPFDDAKSIVSMASTLSQASQFTMVTITTDMINQQEDNQFLILDLREEEEYDMFRIKEAINYPAPNLKRDKYFPLLLKFVPRFLFTSVTSLEKCSQQEDHRLPSR